MVEQRAKTFSRHLHRALVATGVAMAFAVGFVGCGPPPSNEVASSERGASGSGTEETPADSENARSYSLAETPLVTESRVELTALLLSERFDELERRLSKALVDGRNDYRLEINAGVAWLTFDATRSEIGDAVQRWVAAAPESALANAAYAEHLMSKAWEARGSAFASETSEEQWAGLRESVRLADPYLDRAIRLDPELIEPRLTLHWIQLSARMGPPLDKLERDLLELAPASYRVRSQLATARLPRWRGSLPALQAFVDDTLEWVDENPRLRIFAGWPDWALGRIAAGEDRTDDALAHFEEALAKGGESATFLEGRGRARSSKKDYAGARVDLERAAELQPQSIERMTLAARFQARTGDFERANATLEEADAIRPGDARITSATRYVTDRIGDEVQEIGKAQPPGWVERAETLVAELEHRAPDDPWTAYRRAQIDVYKPELDDAERQLVACTERFPDFYNCFVTLDWVLAKRRDWGAIVGHWSRFLEHEPEHAEGYYQRAGAQRRLPDMNAALTDLTRACDLGHRQSCGILARSRRDPGKQRQN